MTRGLGLAGVALALFWPFHRQATKPAPAPKPSAVWGARLYHQACLSCHGPRGDGQGLVLLPDNAPAPPLDHLPPERSTVSFLEQVIRSGSGAMPAWGRAMTPAEIRSVALYVSGLNAGRTSSRPSAGSTP
jgi:mono/diheme cytochrome c family protein